MRRVAGLNYRTLALGVAVVVLAGLILGSAGLGTVAGATSHATPDHSASAPASHASPTTAAQKIDTTTITFGVVYTPGQTFPGNVTFWTNITFGTITNATVKVAVIAAGAVTLSATGNDTVNSNLVTTFDNNGIPTSNYTWFVPVTEASLGCSDASCADLIGGASGLVQFTIWAWANGAGSGGGIATNTDSWDQPMVSTYSTALFLSPATNPDTEEANPYVQPMNVTVQFELNTSYLALSNATLDVTLNVTIYGAVTLFANLTLNDTLNTTNLWGGSSSIISNGTAWTGWYAEVAYSLNLNATAFGLSTWEDFVTALGADGGYMVLTVWATADGTSAGGIAPGATAAGVSWSYTGTTLFNANTVNSPGSFQPLPFVLTGWLNESWVNPNPATGNATTFGWAFLWDNNLSAPFATFSLNDSVNTTNADGWSLIPAESGVTAAGVPFINYTWSVTLTVAQFNPTAYGDLVWMSINVSADGTPLGAVNNSIAGYDIFPLGPVAFSQNPTTVSTAFTTPVTGYIDVSSSTFWLNWTLTTNSAITPTQTSIVLQVVDATIPYPIMNYTIPVTPGQTSYSFPVTAATFTTCDTNICFESFPTDDFYFTVITVENGVYGPTNGSLATSSASIGPAFFIGTEATISLLSPNGATATLPSGNVTFVTYYAGFFVSGANITVYSASNVVVFTALMTQLETGVPAHAVWAATAAGTYRVVVAMTRTSGGPVYANQTLTIVSSSGSLVYQNSSTYHNVTLLGSLSPAVAGTILLLVGLIVGMIVALLVGRMMWGGSKPQEPPQQWEQGQPAGGSTEAGTTGTGGADTGTPPGGGTS